MTILKLIDVIQPNFIDFSNVTMSPESEEEYLRNAQYTLTMARRLGAPVYALPEDIVELNGQMIMTVFAGLMLVNK